MVAAGSLVGVLPPLAAGLSVVWLSLQITEWLIHKKWKK